MANVRSLLRNELVNRGVVSQSGSVATRVTKKRKIESNSDELVRKKSRGALPTLENPPSDAQPSEPAAAAAADSNEQDQEDTDTAHVSSEEAADLALTPEDEGDVEEPASTVQTPSDAPQGGLQTVDEDEWAAFEREVVAPTRTRAHPAAMATATISAAPVSAQEIIAQQRKEMEDLARAREADVEGEKEDAARLLEEEFDEMAQLEERVRRLKEKREELRKRRMENGQVLDATVESAPPDKEDDNWDSDESGSGEDGGGWEDWRFR
jgi:hypothetical protein